MNENEYIGKLGIRQATLEDIPNLVEIGRRLHELFPHSAYSYDPNRSDNYNAKLISTQLRGIILNHRGNYRFFIADDESGKPAGALICYADQMLFTQDLVASLMFYVVLPGHAGDGTALRLFRAFLHWAEGTGAKAINVATTSGEKIEELDRYLRRFGFRRTGGTYCLIPTSVTPRQDP